MLNYEPRDRDYLALKAQALFPGSSIDVTYEPEEIIHIDVGGHRFTFEIGSDDDEYVFTDGKITFSIPLMDFDEDF